MRNAVCFFMKNSARASIGGAKLVKVSGLGFFSGRFLLNVDFTALFITLRVRS